MAGRKRSLRRLAAALPLVFACAFTGAIAGAAPLEQALESPMAPIDLEAMLPPMLRPCARRRSMTRRA